MQSAKQSLLFKHFTYEIEINPMGQKKLSIDITDSSTKSQFYEKQLILEQIGVSTLIKAFDKTKKEISFTIEHKKGGEFEMIQLKIQVESQFLRPVNQIVYLKKIRDVSDAQVLRKSIDYIAKKIKDLKVSEQNENKDGLIVVKNLKEQNFAGTNAFEPFSEVTLPKGKYIITWTFLTRATNGLMYCYLNQGQVPFLTNAAFYVPNTQNHVPITLRKIHTVTANEQTLTLHTYCSQSYPSNVRNCIATVKRLD